jgi:hypothetical protein
VISIRIGLLPGMRLERENKIREIPSKLARS